MVGSRWSYRQNVVHQHGVGGEYIPASHMTGSSGGQTPHLWKNTLCRGLVLATGQGNPPVVRVSTAKTGRFGSRTDQKPDPQTPGGPNPDPCPSTRGFRRVWLDPSVPISGSAFRVSHLWSHSDMLLLIVKYWPWYVTVHFRCISRLDVQNKNSQAPNHSLKMSVNTASMIFGLASAVIWVVCDHKYP